ncbi:MAG: hypothetical protein K6T34_02555 [Thermoflavifilum sp.]|nr:hypothetical protein [Thermoflavifilum sp.]
MMKAFTGFLLICIIFLTSCHSGIKEKPSWKTYLDHAHLQGCMMLYDNMHDVVSVYPLQQASQRYAPGNSFLLFSALVALESGLVADTSSMLKLPSGDSASMGIIFRQQPDWLNQWLSTHIRKQVMQFWIDSVHYGKPAQIDTANAYWNNGNLLISPDEQLGLLIHLYFHELPFHERPQRLVQHLMLKETTPNYSWSYLTTSLQTDSAAQAWMIGWEEENKHPYFFSIHVQSYQETPHQLQQRVIALTRQWLKDQGFFEGKK